MTTNSNVEEAREDVGDGGTACGTNERKDEAEVRNEQGDCEGAADEQRSDYPVHPCTL